METIWFCLVAGMFAMYFVLDGYNLGAGTLHLHVARTDEERRTVLGSIGPVWDGNEVWLIAGGGTLYFAFPALYAAGFSGFYLPLIMVLWLLILRGLSIELRHQLDSPVWRSFWDAGWTVSSALLAVTFGAALGNVVRGVPLDADGHFFEPLWTDFQLGPNPGVLDWYTVSVGLAALAALALHGALWLVLKTEGPVRARARQAALALWWSVAALAVLLTVMSFAVQPHVPARFAAQPWGVVFPLLAAAGLAGMRVFLVRGEELRPFLCSAAFIIGMLCSAFFGVYPYVLPSSIDPVHALTVHNAAAAEHGLRIGLLWWVPGMLLATAYFLYTHSRFTGKVRLEGPGY
jgi:cytochrome bd ubiquinol oxidase subunit II